MTPALLIPRLLGPKAIAEITLTLYENKQLAYQYANFLGQKDDSLALTMLQAGLRQAQLQNLLEHPPLAMPDRLPDQSEDLTPSLT